MAQAVIKVISVLPTDRGWVVHDENKATVIVSREKIRAVDEARKMARRKHGQLIVYQRGGDIESAEDFAAVEG